MTSGTIPEGITIDGNVFLQPFNGAGGIVELTARLGDVNTQRITTNGGDLRFEANNGNIFTGDLYSYSYSESGNVANGGAISLTALGNINTGGLYSFSYSDFDSIGNGGSIDLQTNNGNITTGDLFSSSYSPTESLGNGGAIAFTAFGKITTGGIDTEAFGTGNGGDITLTSIAGGIDTTRGTVTSQIKNYLGENRRAGNISFTAKGDLQIAEVNASAGELKEFSGVAGNISIEADGFGNGGDISLKADGNITLGSDASIISDGLLGGNITINSNSDISIAGNIRQPPFNPLSKEWQQLNNVRSSSFTNVSSGDVNGGAIALIGDSISLENSQISGKTYGLANVGQISLNANSRFYLENSSVYGETYGQGNVAPIEVNASPVILRDSGIVANNWQEGYVGLMTVNGGTKVELENSR